MKIEIYLYLVILLVSSESKKSGMKTQNRLEITPKGQYLDNVYNYNQFSNGYGPFPTLQEQTELSISSIGDIDMVDEERVIHCDSEQHEFLAFCLRIKDCDVCASSARCGWCMMRGVCLPKKSKKYKICNQEMCRSGLFIENIDSCQSTKVFGQIDVNVSNDVEGIIKPIMAEKKYRVNTIYTHPAVITTPVLLGIEYQDHDKQWKDIKHNQLVKKQQVISRKPIYGQIKQVRNVNTFKQDIVDSKGIQISHDSSIMYHGYNVD